MKLYIYAILITLAQFCYAQNNETIKWTGSRPDGHAPISVMGDHTHGKGELMFSYRYMYMNMDGINRGSENVDFSNVLRPNDIYMVTPTDMTMQMHMLGMMYAPTNKITLLLMTNYLSSDMNHLTAMGTTFATAASGFGDTKIGVLYKFFNKNRQQLHGQIGVSIPTGSIDEMDITPASAPNQVILPYPMQIGSGTFDPEIALTYLKQWYKISFGTQIRTTLRLVENDNAYQLGNKYSLNNWIAVLATDWLSFSGRVEIGAIDGVKGANPDPNSMMVITADTKNSGKTYTNAGLGLNVYAFQGVLKNLRLGFEASLPLFQNMNGVQLRNKESIIIGLQYVL